RRSPRCTARPAYSRRGRGAGSTGCAACSGSSASLPEHDVLAEGGVRGTTAGRGRIVSDAAGGPDHDDTGPEPPPRVERVARGGRGRLVLLSIASQPALLRLLGGLLLLELRDQLLDLLPVLRVGAELQVPLEAED